MESIHRNKKPKLNDEIQIRDNATSQQSCYSKDKNIVMKVEEPPNTSKEASFLYGLYGILIIGLCVLFSSPILLLPQHNTFISPKYGYEGYITGCLSFTVTFTLDTLIACKFYFKVSSMVSIQHFIRLYLVTVVIGVLIPTLAYLIWSIGLGYNPPMPFVLLLGYVQMLAQYVTLYMSFPKSLTVDPEFRKKIRAFILSRFGVILIHIQYMTCTCLFTFFEDKQWLIAFFMPLLRELNFQMLNKILIVLPGIKDEGMNAAIVIGMNTFHALYVAVKIGHTVSQTTSNLILAIDFILNLIGCYNIIKLHKRITPRNFPRNSLNVREKEEQLLKLILIEILEVIVPFTYIVTVLIAYYGPNAELLGNIRNDYWQFEAIDDIGKVVLAVLLMFAIDLCSAVIAGIALWKQCQINFLLKACGAIKTYWTVIAVNLANYLNHVSIHKAVAYRCYHRCIHFHNVY